MNAKQALTDFQEQIAPFIQEFFAGQLPVARNISQPSADVILHLQEFTLRKAKRLRAALMYYTYLLMGGENTTEMLRTAVAIEVLQSYLLVHDDVMDQDSLRRGKPSMHKIYEQKLTDPQFSALREHYGEAMAICIGDVACHLSLQIITDADFAAEYKVKALSKLHQQITSVGQGQILDVNGSFGAVVDEQYVINVHKYKTAKYTYETPMTVGALLAGAVDADLEILSDYAINAGIAFQIQDDILGMFGDEEKLGKPNISDLREGKQTLLILKALEQATPEQSRIIKSALGNKRVTQELAGQVRQIIIATGSLEYSKQLAIDYVRKAKAALARRPKWQNSGREFLDSIADYMIEREF